MKQQRSSLETLVFGTALLLFFLLVYFAYQRWPGRNAEPAAAQKEEEYAPDEGTLQHSGTENAVSETPSVRVKPEGTPRKTRRQPAVPAPTR